MTARGERIAVNRPADTSEFTLVASGDLPVEITRLFIVNVDASAHDFRLFHVPDGDAAGLDNALYYDTAVAANSTFTFGADSDDAGITLRPGETLVGRSDAANDLVFHVYGVTANIAPEIGN